MSLADFSEINMIGEVGGTGGGTISVAIQPAAGEEWEVQAVYIRNTDGANRECFVRVTDGTEDLYFAATDIVTAKNAVLAPFNQKNLIINNSNYIRVMSTETWTDRATCAIKVLYRKRVLP